MRINLNKTTARFTAILLAATTWASAPGCDAPAYPPYDRVQLLRETTDMLVIPAFEESATRAGTLRTATSALCATPSAATLASARTAWLDSLVAWHRTVAYQMGPGRVADLETFTRWPADLTAVEGVVSGTTTIDAAFVDTLGESQKGFATLEYFLFAYPGFTTADDTMTLAALADTRRCTYAAMLADQIARVMEGVHTAWLPTGGNYRDVFVNASDPTEYSSPQAAVAALVNQIEEAINQGRDDRLGRPLGRTTTSGPPQSPYAHASVAAMEALFESASDAWSAAPHGVSAFLETRNASLAASVSAQFTTCRADLAALESPPLASVYETYVTGTDHAAGDAAYDCERGLQTTLASDVASTLGISVILPADGD